MEGIIAVVAIVIFLAVVCCLLRGTEEDYSQREGSTIRYPLASNYLSQENFWAVPESCVDRGNWQTELHEFVEHIILSFKRQRKRDKYQFAVLLLLPYRTIPRNLILQTRTGVVSPMDEVTNRNAPTFPPHDDRCNFITARPDGLTHAEALLMPCVASLMTNYRAQKMPECDTILLFTWFFPCDNCKQKILRTLQSYTRDHRVILVYIKILYDSMDKGQVSKSTREFKQAGIEVIKETYDDFMLPA